jgi:hypothetical protein
MIASIPSLQSVLMCLFRSYLTFQVFLAANRMTRRAMKHCRLLPYTIPFIFYPSIHNWTLCSPCHQTKSTTVHPKQTTNFQSRVEVYPSSFFNLYPRCGTVVKATPRPLYIREKTRYLLYRVGPKAGLNGRGNLSPPTGNASAIRSKWPHRANNSPHPPETHTINWNSLQEKCNSLKMALGCRNMSG